MADCIFCKIIAKDIPAEIIQENDDFFVFLDVKPVNPGHLLIIPKEHIESIFDLPADLYEKAFNIAKALSAPLQKAMEAKKIGIAVEGFGVSHAHIHLVPLHAIGELNPERARLMEPAELNAIAKRIKEQLNKIKID